MKNELHIVLIEPEIPQNTGNIGRSCIGLGATLHLVGRLGFSLSGKEIRRSGLDYWPKLKLVQHKDWETFLRTLPKEAALHFFSTKGKQTFWEREFRSPCYLIFGSESRGLPPSFYRDYEDRLVRIPHSKDIRSLNLSAAVGIAAFEATRRMS